MKNKYFIPIIIFILIFIICYIVFILSKDRIVQYIEFKKYHIDSNDYTIELKKKDTQLNLLNKSQRIPKIIHQTYIRNVMDVEYYETCMINKNMNIEYEYKFYNDDDIRNYIINNCPEYIEAYDKLIPGAYKADLFRYIILYKEGGVYIDCKASTIFPLREFINPDIGFISFKDRLPGTIQISFIASVAGHPILKNCIDLTIYNIMNEIYGINFLDITGPQVCGRVYNILLKRPELSEIEEDIFKEIDAEIIGSFLTIGKNKYEVLCDKNLKPLLSRSCGSYHNKKLSINDYGIKWKIRKVFK